MPKSSPDNPANDFGDPAREIRRLRRRVAELEAAMAERGRPGPAGEISAGNGPFSDGLADSPETAGRPEERFRKLLAAVPNVSVQGYRGDGTVFYWNEGSRSVYGYGPEEAVGRNLVDLIIPEEMRDMVQADIRQMAETGIASPAMELALRRKDGSTVPVFSNHAVIAGPDGEREIYCLDLDLTENRRLTRALRRSEERLRLAMDAADDGYWDWDLRTGRVYWSPRCYTMLGYPPDAFPMDFERWQELIHPDEREATRKAVEEKIHRGGTFLAEFRYRTADGGWRWIMGRGRTVKRDDSGAPIRMVGTHVDVHDRKMAEAALRESEARYRLLAENVTDVIWTMTPEGRFTYMSPSVERLRGFTPEEVMARPMEATLTPESARLARKALGNALARDRGTDGPAKPVRLELTQPCKDGSIIPTEIVASPIYDSGGRLEGILGVTRDIGDRKRAERAQRKTARLLESILDHSPALITVLDADARYVLVNQAAAEAIGKPADRLRGRAAADVLPAEMASRFQGRIRQVLRERTPMTVHESIPLATGLRDFETTLFPIETADGPLLGGIARDVTERNQAEANQRELERRLLHAQKLESLGVLAGGVAHDFNNILMTVMGNVELALEDPIVESFTRESLEEALKAARRAADLTRQMLAYSGKGKFLSQRLDMNELIRENAPMIRVPLAGRCSLALNLADSLPPILADPEQIRQVLMNLAANAAEAIGEDAGTVTLQTDLAELDAKTLAAGAADPPPPPGSYVRLSVIDNGGGMDAETRQRLFDPFFSTKFLGRGLGMSAVQGIVRGHDGSLFVESVPGRGTTVAAAFPAMEIPGDTASEAEAGERSPARAASSAETESRVVLVVDDDEAVRRLGEAMVARLGYQTRSARDGIDALETFREHGHEIVAVLLDWRMPRLDGPRTAEALRELAPDLPILLSSGFSREEAGRRLGPADVSGFIQKPYRMSALRDAFQRLLPPRRR
jgi:PAS domain S-box-containing protein